VKKGEGVTEAVPDGKLRVRVQISREKFLAMKSYFLEIATHRRAEAIAHV
jgi:hypothetical protein